MNQKRFTLDQAVIRNLTEPELEVGDFGTKCGPNCPTQVPQLPPTSLV